MQIFENDEPCTKPYQRLEAEIERIILDYVWQIEPDDDSLDRLPHLVKQLRIETHKDCEKNYGGKE